MESYKKYKNPQNDYEVIWNKYCSCRKWELLEVIYSLEKHNQVTPCYDPNRK